MQLQSLSPAYCPWTSGAPGGLGATPSQTIALQTVSTAGSILAGTAPLWAGGGAAAAGAGAGAAGAGAGAAGGGAATTAAMSSVVIPIIGVAVAGVTLALIAIFNRKGPKQKTETTQVVEEVIRQLQANLAAYQAGPHTISSQAQALANFDAGWQLILQNCGQQEMGDPGQRCILERMPRRLCDVAYSNPSAVVSWWKPDLNEVLSHQECGKYEMQGDLRDPIANDPNVRPDPILGATGEVIGESLQQVASLIPGGGTGLLLLGGAALLFLFGFGGGK